MSTHPVSDRERIVQAVDALENLILHYFNAAGDLPEKERRGGEILQFFLTTAIAGQSIIPRPELVGVNCPTGQTCVGGVCTGGGYSGLGELSDEGYIKGMVAALREDLLKYLDARTSDEQSSKDRADMIVNEVRNVVIAGQKL